MSDDTIYISDIKEYHQLMIAMRGFILELRFLKDECYSFCDAGEFWSKFVQSLIALSTRADKIKDKTMIKIKPAQRINRWKDRR